MKMRTAMEVARDLHAIGLEAKDAAEFSGGAGLANNVAREFVDSNRTRLGNISPGQQLRLFSTVYQEMLYDVRRISSKSDVVAQYGAVKFDTLNGVIQDVVVDLRYRGDYTVGARQLIQKHMVDNDLPAFSGKVKNEAHWPGVPADRRRRRKEYLEENGG